VATATTTRGRRRGTPGGRRPPRTLTAVAVASALLVALPVLYLLVVVLDRPQSAIDAVWRERTVLLVLRSLGLAIAVAVAAVALAIPLAWLTVRCDLPGRRVWAVLVVLPFVVPSYVAAYVFVSTAGPRGLIQQHLAAPLGIERIPSLYGFVGAFVVLTLVTYPLVLLPVRAALRRMDPALEDAARGLGAGRLRLARTVFLPQVGPAAVAGGLLVALYVLSDFGAVSILRFDSFTRVIHTSYRSSFDRTGAAALAGVLVLVMVVLLAVEGRLRRTAPGARVSPGAARRAPTVPLGRWKVPALLLCGVVVAVTLVVPVGVLVWWATQATGRAISGSELGTAAGHTLTTAALAAAVATLVAAPAAWLGARHAERRGVRLIEGGLHVGYALPGIVVALAFVFLGIRAIPALYQTLAMAIAALVVLYVPLALGALRGSIAQIPPSLEEAARGLGRRPPAVLATVVLPLVRPGVTAALILVSLAAAKELPALLLLAPTGYDTLATQLWQQTNLSVFERAAVPALVLLVVSAPPLAWLVLRDR
jgi:iron(III) transport system permease protein